MGRVSAKYKLGLFLLFAACYVVFYIYPNFRPLSEASFLPLLFIDRAVPFLPWTFFIYVSDYLLVFFTICLVKEKSEFDAFARSAFLVLFISGTCFFLYPTLYPRPEYPKVDNVLLALLMDTIMVADKPSNCFPSMHVAITGMSAWVLRDKGPRVFGAFILWSIAIFLSTLTTKQHYFVDIVGGLGVVALAAGLEWALFSKRLKRSSRLNLACH